MTKIEVFQAEDGTCFNAESDAKSYEIACAIAKLLTLPGFGNSQENWRENIPRAVNLIEKCDKTRELFDQLREIKPSRDFHLRGFKRPR